MKTQKCLSILRLSLASIALASCGGGSSASSSSSTSKSSSSTSSPQGSSTSSSSKTSSPTGDITRVDAINVLNSIASHVSDATFKAPAFGQISSKTKITTVNSTAGSYTFNSIYMADYKKGDTVLAKANTVVMAFYDESNKFGVMKVDDADASVLVKSVCMDDANKTLETLVGASMKAYLGEATYASGFAKYLGNFKDDGSAVETGGTAGGATLKSQSYSSTGDGNLTVDITAHYVKTTGAYDEAILYKWENYLCVAQKSNDELSLDWKTAVTMSGVDTDGATTVGIEEGKNIAALL